VSAHVPASGEQHEIGHGDHLAVATEVGATLRSYTVAGVDVVDGFSEDELSPSGRGQVLAPWPNRLDRGRYTFEGREGAAALDEPEARNAIHGLVRWLPWHMTERTDDSVALECVLHPQPGNPWRLELGVTYHLDEDGLTVTSHATNRSTVAAPFGIGFHPYLTIGARLDEATLTVPAARRLLTDPRGLPVGEVPVEDSEFDFRQPRAIGDTRLDTGYTKLDRSADSRAYATVEGAGGRSVSVWVDEAFGYLMVYTGDTLQPLERRRLGIAIEPMSCPPNAFASGVDVIRLEPGEPWTGSWGISPQRFASSTSATAVT
jgi:aldose 1-epimerase